MDTNQYRTNLLFYKIYKNIVTPVDFLNWSYELLESDVNSISLNMMASMQAFESIYLFEDYFKKSLNEINMYTPQFEEAARTYVSFLCLEILNKDREAFELTRDIFKVSVELDHPLDLSIWIELDDHIDRIIYDDEQYRPEESEVRKRITNESRNYMVSQGVEDFR